MKTGISLMYLFLNALYIIGVLILKQTEYISQDAFIICIVLLIINSTVVNLKGEE